ncbi:Vacuolar iron transporter 1 [Spatholobus suberectus]|nr:Vacuolar iron transporter 1 [Spatholobus suberectus]
MTDVKHKLLEPEKHVLLNRHKEKHFITGKITCDIIIIVFAVSDRLTIRFTLIGDFSDANSTSSNERCLQLPKVKEVWI